MKMVAPLEVGICCQNLEALKRFYIEQLTFAEISYFKIAADKAGDTGLTKGAYKVVRLQSPYGERLKLLEPQTAPVAANHSDTILEQKGNVYLTFIVDDLAAMLAKLKKNGAELLSGEEIVEVRPGTCLIFARDPEGNIIEFVEYSDILGYRPDLVGK
tara:strand:- start:11083 stop:11556 length:474 start_codon:yes stop_codon:yes gene_type:complete